MTALRSAGRTSRRERTLKKCGISFSGHTAAIPNKIFHYFAAKFVSKIFALDLRAMFYFDVAHDVQSSIENKFGERAVSGFCFLNKLSELRMLTTFYSAKNDNRWVNYISLKTIT